MYNVSIIDNTTTLMQAGEPGLGGMLPDIPGTLIAQESVCGAGGCTQATPNVNPLGLTIDAALQIRLREAGGAYPVTAMTYNKIVFVNSVFQTRVEVGTDVDGCIEERGAEAFENYECTDRM